MILLRDVKHLMSLHHEVESLTTYNWFACYKIDKVLANKTLLAHPGWAKMI